MKKTFAILLITLYSVFCFSQAGSFVDVTLTGAAQNVDFGPTALPTLIWLNHGGITLTGNLNVDVTSIPPDGYEWTVANPTGIDLNGHVACVFGYCFTQEVLDNAWYIHFFTENGVVQYYSAPLRMDDNSQINGRMIIGGTLDYGAAGADLTAGEIFVGNASNRPTAVAPTGDITLSSAGVTAIASGVVVNADINASAAIARSKLASGTANHVVINDGSGVLSSEARLSPSRGGLGIDASASTGFVTYAGGTASIGSFTDSKTFMVSFDSSYTDMRSDNKILFPFAGTVTGIYAYAVSDIAGVNNGTITPKNNSGTTMTSGTITFTASDTKGTAYTSTPSANNTFLAGDILSFETSKPNDPGGNVLLTVTYIRNK